ncbi:MAG: 2-oxoacid:acceptor oxidoreductase family protein [Candidatus Omnitrophica bacterium]|nr:2-oxoacid:acceptor oxidoreductase family protein [Candidatus Omnitrophota bacterium]MDD5081364.1 2-oxoacid:acceptor oxidoreductase family protein [Candidatus Omnitrophota bacterium]
MKKTFTILFYGIGGQGVLTASEICALACMNEGFHVKKSEVKGMAQRGGSVESYVRFGKNVYAPLPEDETTDILVCLSTEEYLRMKNQLKATGKDLFSYLDSADKAVGDRKIFINTYILGALSVFLPVKEENWLKALDDKLKKAKEENKQFFLMGRKKAQNDI